MSMKIIPMAQISNDDAIPKNATLDSLTLELLDDPSLIIKEDECKRCLDALERSAFRTLRSLAFSGGSFLIPLSGDSTLLEALPPGLTKDTWLAVSSLLASGLPMPKSPSGELPRLGSILNSRSVRSTGGYSGSLGTGNNASNQSRDIGTDGHEEKVMEREERGWWALRFQQVLGEMKRRSEFCTSEF